uniref:Uncharacterized protein LOC114913497 n=1 Tax=Elaeis guineensis var. tenera TaxID=51953 RepID=A0A8N4EV47_ELAGV|nr:uncharacterized protein LOC114913497 [Elaeis guineensis]
MVVSLDDYNLILGNDFFIAGKVAILPHLFGLMIHDEKKPYFVTRCNIPSNAGVREPKMEMVSAMQLARGWKWGQMTYVAALIDVGPDETAEVPKEVAEILQEFDDVMPSELPKGLPPRCAMDHKIDLHKSERHNQVADALSRKGIVEVAAAIFSVEADFTDKIRMAAQLDKGYQKLLQQVRDAVIRRYWVEEGLLMGKGNRLYIPDGKGLRRQLMKESHDSQWAGYPERERMMALLSRTFVWAKMEEDIETYVRSCLVCQQDKVERHKEAGLLQPLPIAKKP